MALVPSNVASAGQIPGDLYFALKEDIPTQQVLSQSGNAISLSGGGGSVNVAATTAVATSTQKLTGVQYVSGLQSTNFTGQVTLDSGLNGSSLYKGGTLELTRDTINPALVMSRQDIVGQGAIEYDGSKFLLPAVGLNNEIYDSMGNPGAAGQQLQSSGPGLPWVWGAGSGVGLTAVVAGTNISVDNTNPIAPVVGVAVSSNIDMSGQEILNCADITVKGSTPGLNFQNSAGVAQGDLTYIEVTDTLRMLSDNIQIKTAVNDDYNIVMGATNGALDIETNDHPIRLIRNDPTGVTPETFVRVDGGGKLFINSATGDVGGIRFEGQGGKGGDLYADEGTASVQLIAGGGLAMNIESATAISAATSAPDTTIQLLANGGSATIELIDTAGVGSINITAPTISITGDITTTGDISGAVDIYAQTGTFTGAVSANSIASTTNIQTATLTATGDINADSVFATDISATLLTSTGAVNAASVAATGGITSASVASTTGAIQNLVVGTTGVATPPLYVRATSNALPPNNAVHIENISTGLGQQAITSMRTQPAGGNPFVSWDIAGAQGWSMGIDNIDADKLKISSAYDSLTSATRMTIDSVGQVGIGKTAPSFPLDVAAGSNNGIRIEGPTNPQLNIKTTVGADVREALISLKSGATDKALQFFNATASLAPTDSAYTWLANSTAQLMGLQNDGRLVLNASDGRIYMANNSWGGIQLRSSQAGANTAEEYFISRGGNSTYKDFITIHANNTVGSGFAVLTPGAVPRLHVNGNTGGVTIAGDDSYGYPLRVNGNLNVGGQWGSQYNHIRMGTGNSYGYIYGSYPKFFDNFNIGNNYYADAAGNNVIPNTGAGTSRISMGFGHVGIYTGATNTQPTTLAGFFTNGRLGVGMTNPQAPLHVTDTTTFHTMRVGEVSKTTYVAFDTSIGTYGIGLIGCSFSGVADLPFIINRYGGTGTPVLIGNITATTAAYKLEVDGNAAKTGGGVWATSSDARVKKDISDADLTICYENIKGMRLKHFKWDEEYLDKDAEPDRHVLGFIAQEVKEKFPKAVKVVPKKQFCVHKYDASGNIMRDADNRELFEHKYMDDFHTLNTDQIDKAHIGATQRLMEIVEAQAARIEALEAKMNALISQASV